MHDTTPISSPSMWKTAVLVTLIALGCGAEPSTHNRTAATDANSDRGAQDARSIRVDSESSLLAHLRNLSDEWRADTVHVYTPNDSLSEMWGRPIGGDWEAYFYPVYGDRMAESSPNIYAVGWMSTGPSLSGYVLRVPSRYSSSAMALWIYNDEVGRWFAPLTIADAYADAGWSFQADAWLVDRNEDGYRDLVQRRTEWEMDFESEDAVRRVVADSISWRFFQHAFHTWRWREELGEVEGEFFKLAEH